MVLEVAGSEIYGATGDEGNFLKRDRPENDATCDLEDAEPESWIETVKTLEG